jgi:hypothetical protein
MNSAVVKSIGSKALLALAWVVAAIKAVTCEQLTAFQSKIPDDLSDAATWLSFIIAVAWSVYSAKRSKKAHEA